MVDMCVFLYTKDWSEKIDERKIKPIFRVIAALGKFFPSFVRSFTGEMYLPTSALL